VVDGCEKWLVSIGRVGESRMRGLSSGTHRATPWWAAKERLAWKIDLGCDQPRWGNLGQGTVLNFECGK
jgi:hypothetical protein